MIEIKTLLSRAAARISRGVATLGGAIREMICGRTHWKHSIKAGEVFPVLTRQPLPAKKSNNERKETE